MKKKNIIWIDSNVNNQENKKTLEILKKNLINYDFSTFTTVSSAFSQIKNNKFHFTLFYVIVSGRLAEDFFNEYSKATIELPILAATIVYCLNKSLHEKKPYYLDPFLNPGKITDSYDKIIEYIKLDECNWGNYMNIKEEEWKPEEENFGETFIHANSLSDIAYPIYLHKIINSSLIESNDIIELQNYLLKYFPHYKEYIKPSQEKNIDIPYHILAKFFLRMYTCEGGISQINFYSKLNKDLSNSYFDRYKTFIFLMYNALNKKTINNYNSKIYRGSKLKKDEFNKLREIFDKSKNNNTNDNSINSPFYFSKVFLSFSKNENVANHNIFKNYIKNKKKEDEKYIFDLKKISDFDFIDVNINEDIYVKYILHSNKDGNFLSTNLNINNLSAYINEDEVLVLPLSCFIIKDIKDKIIYYEKTKINIKEIHLYYLSEYKQQLDKYISEIKNKENLQKFFEDILLSKSGHKISNILGDEFNENLKIFFEQITPFEINYSLHILKKLKSYKKGHFKKHKKNIHKINTQNKPIKKCEDIGHFKFSKGMKQMRNEIKLENGNFGEKNYLHRHHSHHKIFKFKRNQYFTYSMYGSAIGNFTVNYNKFKESSNLDKIKIIGMNAANLLLPEVTNKIPMLEYGLMVGGLLKNSYDNIRGGTLYKSEIFKSISKNLTETAIDIGINASFIQLGSLISISLGIVSGPGVVLFGLAGGFLGGITTGLFNRWNNSPLTLNTDCCYYKYVPKKYRKKYSNPNLRWNNVSNNTKSFVIEMVDHCYNIKWLVLNVPNHLREIKEFNNKGDTIIEYEGIKFNSYKIFFNLYEIKKEKITFEDWKKKEKINDLIIQMASIEVY